jgi:hypothetical protein
VGSLSCLSVPPLFWTTLLQYAAAGVLAGNVYLCGGRNASSIQSACWSWQPGATAWQSAASLIRERIGMTMTRVGNMLGNSLFLKENFEKNKNKLLILDRMQLHNDADYFRNR